MQRSGHSTLYGAVRRSIRHEQREEDDGKGDHALAREEGLLVKGFAPHNEVHRPLGGGGAAGGHGQRHVGLLVG
jgi:hypothetical protein